MKTITKLLASAVVVSAAMAFTPAALTGLQIAQKSQEADNGWGSSSNVLTMTLTNRKGQKTVRQMHGYSMEVDGDGDKSMTIFDTPQDVKGTASMTFTHKVGDDDQWLYLPAINRVKRISSSSKSGPFMGSEFAFEDLSSQEVEKYTDYKLLAEETVNGALCYKVSCKPVSKTSGYTKLINWINKDNYRVEQTVYFDRKGAKLKTLTFSKFHKHIGKYWRASVMNMVNHQNGKKTELVFSELKFGINLTDDDFSQNALKNAK